MTALRSPGLTPGRFRLAVRRPRVPRRWRTGLMIVGAVIIGCWLLVALLAPLISPDDPLAQNAGPLLPPSAWHLFGTDENGRDVLSRVLYGARVSLPLGVILVLLQLVIGGILGTIVGIFFGFVMSKGLENQGIQFSVPVGQLIIFLIVSAIVGVLAAILPARRASRVKILEALSYE